MISHWKRPIRGGSRNKKNNIYIYQEENHDPSPVSSDKCFSCSLYVNLFSYLISVVQDEVAVAMTDGIDRTTMDAQVGVEPAEAIRTTTLHSRTTINANSSKEEATVNNPTGMSGLLAIIFYMFCDG